MRPTARAQLAPSRRLARSPAAGSHQGLRRWGPAVLTLLAAAFVLGGLIRLVTDDRVVEVVSFRELDSVAAELKLNDAR